VRQKGSFITPGPEVLGQWTIAMLLKKTNIVAREGHRSKNN